jgi:signal transduction histidine kinase
MSQKLEEHFRIDPVVVFKLGQELISDELQALLELVKNSYDADASYVRVRIDTEGSPEGLILGDDLERPGFIEIDDDGSGMDLESIRNGWLLIARSQKAEFKEQRKETAKGRTPLGDKGLGRLGAQRLGWGLQLETKTEKEKQALVVAFSWEDFFTANTLDEVDVRMEGRPAEKPHGTKIVVSELERPDQWRGDKAIARLQKGLSQVISPYEGVAGFTIAVEVDGISIDLQTINRQVLDTSHLHYNIFFDGKNLKLKGKASLSLFRPSGGDKRDAFGKYVEADSGAEFLERLLGTPAAETFQLKKGSGRWFVTFEQTRALSDVVAELPVDENGEIANPGPFRSEVDSFDLGSGDDERMEVFGSLKPYRQFIKEMAGIRVYRDGFAVRVDEDWLGLGKQWTSASSYYGLKPDTTLGYVALTARENSQLVEKTDREGFNDTSSYQALKALMGGFLEFTGDVQGTLRREFVAYFNERLEVEADVPENSTAEEISKDIDSTLKEARSAKDKVESSRARMNEAMGVAETAAADDSGSTEEKAERMAEAAQKLRVAVKQSQTTFDEVRDLLARIETVEAKNKLVREQVIQLREQLEQSVETMGLGLTAEALSHEMFNIADNLAGRTKALAQELDKGKVSDREVKRYVAHVRATVDALRKELAHFSPSMRYVRERRERIDMLTFGEDLAAYYNDHWQDDGISIDVKDGSNQPFMVFGGRGRLTQVFDNLLLNSKYWIGVAQKQRDIDQGRISIQLKRPLVIVSDNGPGVEPSAEDLLFDPFVTRKPRGSGRGLGLFISRQLLESEGCVIELGPKRNANERRCEFRLNLSGMLEE